MVILYQTLHSIGYGVRTTKRKFRKLGWGKISFNSCMFPIVVVLKLIQILGLLSFTGPFSILYLINNTILRDGSEIFFEITLLDLRFFCVSVWLYIYVSWILEPVSYTFSISIDGNPFCLRLRHKKPIYNGLVLLCPGQ